MSSDIDKVSLYKNSTVGLFARDPDGKCHWNDPKSFNEGLRPFYFETNVVGDINLTKSLVMESSNIQWKFNPALLLFECILKNERTWEFNSHFWIHFSIFIIM
jgi:hypothetical protein